MPPVRRRRRLALAAATVAAGVSSNVAIAFVNSGPTQLQTLTAARSQGPLPSTTGLAPFSAASKASTADIRLYQTASALNTLVSLPIPTDDKRDADSVRSKPGLGGRIRSFLQRDRSEASAAAAAPAEDANANRKMLKENAFAILAGLCLSFNAGFVNGACMSGLLHSSGAKVSVAGFTGAYTQAGMAVAMGDWATFKFFGKMISSFVGGSMIGGLLNPRPVPNRMGPTYGPTFLVGSFLLAASSFRAFRSAPGLGVFYLAAAANGLQNSMTSMYTANLVRSCHMTGTSTDIGMILGQILGGNRENAWKFLVLTSLAISFTIGGAASYLAVTRFRSLALAFNALFFLAIGMTSIAYTSIQQRVSVWRAASGQWKWKSDAPPSAKDLNELFDRIDADGNGYLDEEEMRVMLKEAGMIVSDAGVTAIFKMADVDGDGTISKDEFFGLIMCDVEGEECSVEEPPLAVMATEGVANKGIGL